MEGSLYEGGALQKKLTIVGDSLHRKFRSQNMNSSPSKKEEWGLLFKFLTKELHLCEKMVLDRKTSELLGINQRSDKNDVDSKGPSRAHVAGDVSEELCQ